MSIAKTYSPKEFEDKWYQFWMENDFFKSVPDEREPYTIVIPPPNVTGVLHMGHMLNNTIQDVLVRRARMKGKNACWVPGTDHASIATEAKVVAMLKEKGIDKKDLSREEFLNYAYEWKDKYGGIILDQLKKLGASCDWSRTAFTMDPALSEAVIDTFIHLHQKGLIYRGVRMVNWDPKGLTAVSDEEVIRKEVNQKLYYIKYQVVSSKPSEESQDLILDTAYLTIATTRPETIMADAAICVNPNDKRYTYLHGKSVFVPLINREIPVILDEYVTMDFGTGCLKVTPAHDLNDYELGQKHHLPVIDILNDNGTLNEKAEILVGEDRFIARKKIAKLLDDAGHLEKVEDYKSQVGFSERTDAAIEPKLSMQWFCDMAEMAGPALDYVNNGDVKLIPDKFINTYRHWMENVKDWCISRQLWWGQQIPAWYAPNGEVVVAKTAEEALEKFKLNTQYTLLTTNELKQDEDVVDTWFSSWLWPISVFDPTVFGNPDAEGNADVNYYYPTNDLVTAPEILFFWVARMIMAGHEFRGEAPFKNVYLTGIVRDKLGRKMSKSLGNSPDPLDLIEKYGADGVRVGMLLCSPAGNDIMFDESSCEQGRNFANKIWNAFRLVKGWEIDESLEFNNKISVSWFDSTMSSYLLKIEDNFSEYRLSDALMATYKLVWDEFCARYLELIKPSFGDKIDKKTFEITLDFFERILTLLHPFMPFLTEELWGEIKSRTLTERCITAKWPILHQDRIYDKTIDDFKYQITSTSEMNNTIFPILSFVGKIRNEKQIPYKEKLNLYIKTESEDYNLSEYLNILSKMGNIESVTKTNEAPKNAVSLILSSSKEVFLTLEGLIDVEAEKENIQKEIDYLNGFLKAVNAKLANERFVANAKPEIVANEQNKKADAEAKIATLQESLAAL